MRNWIIITAALLLLSLKGTGQSALSGEKPENIIIFIGDGMGLSQLSIPYYYAKEEPVFSYFKHIGLVKTSSATDKVTDSAGAATAMFTGRKTYNSAIGVDTDTIPLRNLAENFSTQDYLTGIISTSAITDATPAGFYAHESDRMYKYDIARDLLKSDIDFFAGGGLQYFIDTTGKDLFAENNIEVNFSRLKKIHKPEKGKRYGFLLAMDGMPSILNGRKDFLPRATEIAIDYLAHSTSGFLLLVEGSEIDWAGHMQNPEYLISEVNDFEKAVRVAYDYAAKEGNTLVIVTADHETGGFTLAASGENRYDADYSIINPVFSTSNHSATMVPLLAFGPGAESFIGIYENIAVFYKIMDLIQTR